VIGDVLRPASLRAAALRSAAPALILVLVGWGCGGSGGPGTPVPAETTGPPFVEMIHLDGPPPLRGAVIAGQAGDWLLRNDRLAVVVTSADHAAGFSSSGGVLVDAAPAGGVDILQETYTYFDDRFGRQAVYDTVEPGTAADSTAVVLVARGRDSQDRNLEVETRFLLRRGTEFVEITTTLTRTGTDTLRDFELGDVIEWGRTIVFAPGPGRALPGTRGTVPFLLGYGEGTAYAYVSPEGDLTGPHGHAWSDPIVKTVDLAPGDSATYVRRLVVTRGSPAPAAERAHRIRGDAVEDLPVRVASTQGAPVAGAWVEALAADNSRQGWGLTQEDGRAVLPVPAGRYAVLVVHPNRGRAVSDTLTVAAGEIPETVLELPEPARVDLSARDDTGEASPAKWTFQGMDGTSDPDLGPNYDPSGAGPFVFAPDGKAEALLPPGRYRVLATRGPAYQAWETEIDARPGKGRTLRADLERLPIPAGWVSADFHVHQAPSHDSNLALADRARGLVCEGLDWFAATDHGIRTDFAPVLDTLALAAPLRSLVSEEITTVRYGHFNPYPVLPRFGSSAGLDARELDPAAIFDRVHEENPRALLQVNHPRSGSNGYFDCMGYEPGMPAAEADSLGIRLDFDAMEIANGKDAQGYRKVWKDWMALLGQGRRIVGVGNSDSHHLTGQEPGYPRNYVRLDPDSTGDALALVDAVRAGRVTVSNGPFIDLTVEGTGIGDTLRTSSRTVTAHVRVLAPAWVDVRRVSLFVDGVEDAVFMVAPGPEAVRFDEDVELRVSGSAFVIAVAEGDLSLAPVVPPVVSGGRSRPARPLAFTNPVWVESTRSR